MHLVSSDAKMTYKHMLKTCSIPHSTCSSFVLHHDPNDWLFFFCSVETFVSMATPCRKLPEPWENVFSQVIWRAHKRQILEASHQLAAEHPATPLILKTQIQADSSRYWWSGNWWMIFEPVCNLYDSILDRKPTGTSLSGSQSERLFRLCNYVM